MCGKKIPEDRLEALAVLNKQPHEYTCIGDAPNLMVKGVFSGETGSSQLIITDHLGESYGISKDNKIETVFDQ